MTRIVRSVACVGILFLVRATCASADPIYITSGIITVPGLTTTGVVSLEGTGGFSTSGPLLTGEGRADPLNQCLPCLPGTSISVGGLFSGGALPTTATLGGTTYTGINGLQSNEWIFLEFFGRTVIPAFTDAPTTITAPFTMEGDFLFSLEGVRVPIRGAGIASMFLQPQPVPAGSPPEWYVSGMRYDFNNLTPVPEPATLLMVAGGLAAIARSARRRRWSDETERQKEVKR